MDKTDQKILLELDKNPRASFNQIGKAARISKEVTQYRFKRLVKNKIITGFMAYISMAKLGYTTYKILVKYKSVTKETQEQIADFVRASKVVAWTGYCEGTWDLIITCCSPSFRDFSDFYLEFFSRFGEHFRHKEILLPVDNPILNDKYLADGRLVYEKDFDFRDNKEEIDETDMEIIKNISMNSRATFTEIGKKIGISYWTVAQRYKNLLKRNIILKPKPRIDFRKIGYSYYHFFIELNNEKIRERITAYYKQHKNCIMTMNHLGFYSMHLEFVLKKDEMKEVINDFRERFGRDVAGYEPILVVDEYTLNLLK